MSHLVFEVLQAKIEKNSTFFFLTDFVYKYTCINIFFFFFFFFFFFNFIVICFFLLYYIMKYFFFFYFSDFVYQYTCINIFFFLFLTDLSGTGQKRKNLHEHIGNLDRLSKKGRKVIGKSFTDFVYQYT